VWLPTTCPNHFSSKINSNKFFTIEIVIFNTLRSRNNNQNNINDRKLPCKNVRKDLIETIKLYVVCLHPALMEKNNLKEEKSMCFCYILAHCVQLIKLLCTKFVGSARFRSIHISSHVNINQVFFLKTHFPFIVKYLHCYAKSPAINLNSKRD
jgi:hypothetical protein